MSIFNENGNYINIKDPLERMPYVMQEINMICNNYDYITEGINLNDIKNAIKKAWLKFKTFIVDALRSIKIKLYDNTNKALRFLEQNRPKIAENIKDTGFRIPAFNIIQILFINYNVTVVSVPAIREENSDKSTTEILDIIRGKIVSEDSDPIKSTDFNLDLIMQKIEKDGHDTDLIINGMTPLSTVITQYKAGITNVDSLIRSFEQDKILLQVNKDPDLEFMNGLINIYSVFLSVLIKKLNEGIKVIMHLFKNKDNILEEE
jgi:hypothetical protein